jgi:ribonuclease III
MTLNKKINDATMDVVQIPYNMKNKLITKYDIHRILKNYGVTININQLDIYQKSLTHKSYIVRPGLTDEILNKTKVSRDTVKLQNASNERLEFLGDIVIKLVLGHYLFERYPGEDEGFMTRLKTKIENRDSLAELAKKIGIDDYILISIQIETGSGRSSKKILEDAFESFLGALYLNTNFETCQVFLRTIFETEIDYADLLYRDTNYKDQLLRLYHKNRWSHPVYTLLKENGPSNRKIFTMYVTDDEDRKIGIGVASSKREAEQKSAKQALIHFKQLNDDQIYDDDGEDLNIYNIIY